MRNNRRIARYRNRLATGVGVLAIAAVVTAGSSFCDLHHIGSRSGAQYSVGGSSSNSRISLDYGTAPAAKGNTANTYWLA